MTRDGPRPWPGTAAGGLNGPAPQADMIIGFIAKVAII